MKKKTLIILTIGIVVIFAVALCLAITLKAPQNGSNKSETTTDEDFYAQYPNITGKGENGYFNPATGEYEPYYGDSAIGDIEVGANESEYPGIIQITNPVKLIDDVDKTSGNNMRIPSVLEHLEYYLQMYVAYYLNVNEGDTLEVDYDSYLESNVMPLIRITLHYYDRDIPIRCYWYKTIESKYFIFDSELAPLSDAKPQYTFEDIFGG